MGAIIELYRRDVPGERSARFTPMPPALARVGARRLDHHAATVCVVRGFHYSSRTVRVVWTDEWMIAIWTPPGKAGATCGAAARWPLASAEARSASLPARRPYHLEAEALVGVAGEEALVRLGYWIAGPHEWSVNMISETSSGGRAHSLTVRPAAAPTRWR